MGTRLIVQTYETLFDIEINYFLCNSKRGSFISIQYDDGDLFKKISISSPQGASDSELLLIMLKDYWAQNQLFNGLPEFRGPGIISKELFKKVLGEMKRERKASVLKAAEKRTEFIDYLRAKGLQPTPSGGNEHIWYAKCPYSGGKHFMMVSTQDDSFGCGYCGKKGSQKDLEKWLKDLGHKRS